MADQSERYWRKPRFANYFEFAGAWLIFAILSRLPVDVSSNFLGFVGRTIGPRLRLSNRVRDNIRLVWPDRSETEIETILRGACNHFPRVTNEYWSIQKIQRDQDTRLKISGLEHVDSLKQSGKSGILFAGHIANWEMVTLAAIRLDLPVTVVYRPFNNPLIDAYVRDWQSSTGVELIRKGRKGARRLTDVLKGGGNTIMLVDVRMNDGVQVPFLGIDAMTPSAPAVLAMKYDALLVPVQVVRTGSSHFHVTFEEPRAPQNTGDRNADITATMTWVNDRLSDWITQHPEQWMWFHRRWGKNPTRPD